MGSPQRGKIVIFEVAREATNVSDPAIPSGASIIGKVKKVHMTDKC